MREFTDKGITLRWSEAVTQTVSGVQRVLVEAGPAVSSHDTLRLLFSEAGGPERAVRGWPVGCDPKTGMQQFAATLPLALAGKPMSWRPVLTSRGREVDPGYQQVKPAQKPAADAAPVSPALDHIARFVVPFDANFRTTGETPEGLWLHFAIREGGTVCGPKLNGTIEPVGGDWMQVRPDGVGSLNARAMIKPDDGGAPIMFEDSGICDFGQTAFAALCKGQLPATAPVHIASRYLTSNPNYKWLNRVQGIGIGQASLSDVTLRFDVYSAKGTSDA